VADILRELKAIALSDGERTTDKLKALELLGRHKGSFNDALAIRTGVKLEDLVPRRRQLEPATVEVPKPPEAPTPDPPPLLPAHPRTPEPPRPATRFAEMSFNPFAPRDDSSDA
jgi:hypothetical protein